MVSASELVRIGILPAPRFAPYRQEARSEDMDADRLYEWHAQMSSACMELISHFEVMLRHSIDSTLAAHFNESSKGIPWFLMNTSLARDIEKKIKEARGEAARYSFESRDQIVSRLNFGFWVGMLSRKRDELWQKALHAAFPNANGLRSEVMSHVEKIRVFRNRVAHHDSLLGVDIPFEIERIFLVTGWISSSAENWLRDISRCHEIYKDRPVNPLNTVIVPAKVAWTTYVKTSVYICQPGRFFRDVSRIAFYENKEIKPFIPEILERRDQVPWTDKEAQRLEKAGNQNDITVSNAIKESKTMTDVKGNLLYKHGAYQVFILSRKEDLRKTKKMEKAIQHEKTGKGSAYVRKQRYCALGSLLNASTTENIS